MKKSPHTVLGHWFRQWDRIVDRRIQSRHSKRIHREYYNIYEKNRKRSLRIDLVNALGGTCRNCGYCEDIRALNLDHIQSDAKQDFQHFKDRAKMYRYYLTNLEWAKEKLQILCCNCNQVKRYTHNEFKRGVRP